MPEEGPVAGPASGPEESDAGGTGDGRPAGDRPAAGAEHGAARSAESGAREGKPDGAEEAGGGRFRHPAPEPLEGPVVATVIGGTIIWFVLFLGQLPFYGWFDDHGHLWWLWTCLAGAGLGSFGIWYVRRRDAAIKRHAATADAATQKPPGV